MPARPAHAYCHKRFSPHMCPHTVPHVPHIGSHARAPR
ncbi:hypothetical protein STPYR_12772 [uncultured Stenotrophomonas sp.]|uniref:Uncharacterized protein n=1 Tax=uncultured Stenotrophomonas sp. TaxID=165438 RepID=A0A1Y5Q694_9GAMM|nr:hypothetical protein STPYR_12772 [uncultured Stenotrophomonas sp.]